MSPQPKLLNHPMREKIIFWLKVDGVSVRDVEKRLAQIYVKKSDEHLRVSASAIQAFKTDHLQIEGKVLAQIKENSKLTRTWTKKQEQTEELAKTSTAYQEAMVKAAQMEIDTKQKLINVFTIIENRLEKIYNKVDSFDYLDRDAENLLLGYVKQLQATIDQHKKYEEGFKESIDVNLNLNIMNDQIHIMRDAVRETLAELDPEVSIKFLDKLNTKMKRLTLGGSMEANNKHAMLLDSALGGSIIEADFD